ncbi:hypothetical protein FB565_004081 [Actinoplanes lutulentus]|uniref:Sulfatase-modifying factor enzyme 1 n=1 Tax=Actinoplanes lutulentus TaxID=1287878 RepID=A0A327ZJK4_9ACTN|nr:formylglycine-generating enzyme family protein [Actinoplanes lutulentus]MBB2944352.1 hypothetical protein [Actinoplanes lutulentus]RAK42415.1 sulfatase-modifying factor enzyme 1 [Actinoplanes lutulentus]
MEPSLNLIRVPAGLVTLSDRRSSRQWSVEVAAFQLSSIPLTASSSLPLVNVSWWDAIRLCNELSAREGLTPAYRLLPPTPDQPPPSSSPRSSPTGPVIRNAPLATALRPGTSKPGASEPDASKPDALRPGALGPGALRPGAFGDGALGDEDGNGRDGDGIVWDRSADGYRLPTEAEWEHACRAGTTGPRYGPLDDIAWHRANSGDRIHPPGGKQPNAWGLHDMLGNAWEWCWDRYDPEIYGEYRVLRGGGWFDEHWSCRASVRRRSHPDLNLDDVTFRPARSLPT